MIFKRATIGYLICTLIGMAQPTAAITLPRAQVIEIIRYKGLTTTPTNNIPHTASLNSKVGQKIIDNAVYQDINMLYATGYFKSVEAIPSVNSANGITLTFKLQEYPLINDVKFIGGDAITEKLITIPPIISRGIALNTVDLQKYLSAIETTYHNAGYDLARVLQSTFTPSGDVVIEISEGEINRIEILGIASELVPVMLREMKSKPGSHFNTRRLREDRERLLKLGYFSDIESPRLADSLDHRRVNVVFTTHPRKNNSLDAGLEYYERKGEEPLTGFIRTDLRHIAIPSDITSLKIQSAWKDGSPYIQGYGVRYTQPWLLNALPLSFSIGTWSEQLYEFLTADRNNFSRTTYSNQRIGIDAELAYPFTDDFTVAIRGKSETIQPDESSGVEKYNIRSLSFKTDYRTIRNLTNPRNGFYFVTTFEVGGNLGFVNVGGLAFTRGVSTLAAFTEIGSNGVLAARTTVGTFTPDSETSSTFESEGFDLGGPNTIRGYKETFPVFVGNKELLFSLEYRHDITTHFQTVAFVDTGYAFTGDWPTTFSNFATGYGLGVRFYTPVGAIRLDIAQGEALIIHFGLGQSF